jgi:thioredoxin-related protein
VKSIKEVYPYCESNDEYSWFDSPYDYTPMLDSFGFEKLLQVDDSDYQGDSRVLYKDDNRYGILIFGWGSCSGCDALQGCESFKELEDLQKELFDQIKWFESKEELLKYLTTHDWEGDYCWHAEETRDFVMKCIKEAAKT